jgi:1-acyl-sn-glycerol-3-phosphate acyltransferase
MIAKIRAGSALLVIVVTGLLLAPIQYTIVRTGWGNPTIIPRNWHRLVVWALGLRVTMRGQVATDRPLLLASNHVSWADIAVLSSLTSVCFLAKAEVARWPIFGGLARMQRTVFVDRERKRSSGEQASELAQRLVAGDVMILFPEGSTGDGNLLLPFKSTLFGAAEMAIREGAADAVNIQPVAISYVRIHGMPMGRQHRRLASWIGDADLIPHFSMLLGEGSIDVDVSFGEPILFSAASDRKKVTRAMEDDVRRMAAAALHNARAVSRAR